MFIGRVPNLLCTDRGRAINHGQPGWEKTWPKQLSRVLEKYLRRRGYRRKCRIIDFLGGMPGNIALTLAWR